MHLNGQFLWIGWTVPTLTKPQDPAPARKKHGRSWHRTAGKPVRWWMIALLLVIGFHRWIPDTRWLMVHMVTLGLITTSIMVWSQHFTEALLHHHQSASMPTISTTVPAVTP